MRYEILEKAFSLQREHDSSADAQFAGWLIAYIAKETGRTPSRIDGAGNIIYENGGKTLFAAHIDSAHHVKGKEKPNLYAMKNLKGNKIKSMKNAATVHAVNDPLGADDAVGVLCLVELLCAGQEGSYVFTRGEECGGIGAAYLAQNFGPWLAKHSRAICFDRRDTHEVLTHQGGERCASDKFGMALCDALNDQGMLYDTSTTGVYTDCKEWIDDIPECVNVGAGYWNEHGDREYVDLNHVRALVYAIVRIQWDSLPTDRDCSKPEYLSYKPTGKLSNNLESSTLGMDMGTRLPAEKAVSWSDRFYKALWFAAYGDAYDLQVMMDDYTFEKEAQYSVDVCLMSKAEFKKLYCLPYKEAIEKLLVKCKVQLKEKDLAWLQ